MQPLGDTVGLRILAVYGGASIGRQVTALRRGADIVVATPGRLIDLLERKEVSLGQVEITVLDEADHMVDLGFLPAVTQLLDATPPRGQRLLFSATLDHAVEKVVRTYLSDPALHAVASAAAPVATDHRVFVMSAQDKVAVATDVARRPARTLFFVRTKHGADRLAKQFTNAGVPAAAIHGNLNQNQRQRALAAFAAGSPRVLVATDVAARGIHVDDVDLVVHFDPPADHKDYLHRSGRTARAGAKGTVLSMLLPEQARDAGRLFERAGLDVPVTAVAPGHDAVAALGRSGEPIVVRAAEPVAPQRSSGGRSGRPNHGRRPGQRPGRTDTRRAPAA
jgi:superfamily II DNA/RNA helicase